MEFFKEPFIVRLQILRQGKKKQQVSFRLEADFKREIFGIAQTSQAFVEKEDTIKRTALWFYSQNLQLLYVNNFARLDMVSCHKDNRRALKRLNSFRWEAFLY